MTRYEEISFPEGWFNTYPQTPPKKTQHVPKKSQTTNRPDKQPDILQPVYSLIQLLLQAWSGLLSLTISMSRDENDKNPKVSEQKTNKQANTDGSPTGINPKKECTICNGPHSNLMSCPKMTQYLPFGRYHPTPMWLCPQCLSTKH